MLIFKHASNNYKTMYYVYNNLKQELWYDDGKNVFLTKPYVKNCNALS